MVCCCKLESSRNSQEGPRPPAHHCWRCGRASPVFPGVQVPAALPWPSPGASPLEPPRWEACAPKAPAPSPPSSLAPSPAAHSLKGGQSCISSQPATPENKENVPPLPIVTGPEARCGLSVPVVQGCRQRSGLEKHYNYSYPASPVPFSFFPWGWRTSRGGKMPADCLTGDQPQAACNGAPGAAL